MDMVSLASEGHLAKREGCRGKNLRDVTASGEIKNRVETERTERIITTAQSYGLFCSSADPTGTCLILRTEFPLLGRGNAITTRMSVGLQHLSG